MSKCKGSFRLSNDFFVVKRNRRIYKQLTAIIATFAAGYVSFVVYLLWTIIANMSESKASDKMLDYWFGIISYLCVRSSECVDPLIYSLSSSQLRNQVVKPVKLIVSPFKCFSDYFRSILKVFSIIKRFVLHLFSVLKVY